MKDAMNGMTGPSLNGEGGKRRGRPQGPPRDLGEGASVTARRQAAVILEVLGGVRTPVDAAHVLEVTLPRYYQLETRAVQGLLLACEPRPMGRTQAAASALAALREECVRLRRDCARQQALVRVAQRTINVPAPSAKPNKPGKGRRRRPMVRALRAAARVRPLEEQPMEPAV